jgi:hypothetical protein
MNRIAGFVPGLAAVAYRVEVEAAGKAACSPRDSMR